MVTPDSLSPALPQYGKVNHILSQSFVDGPGNRAVIFLQGCNFQCLYCHNPFTINLCTSCGICVPTCPSGALTIQDGQVFWNEDICTGGDACIQACPTFSSPKVRLYTPEELWKSLLPYTAFISGISVSGGEPALQADFLAQFFQIVKTGSRLTTLIETNGYAGPETYAALLPYLDIALVDLKIIDAEKHARLTGHELSPVLETIRFLRTRDKLGGVNEVIVPGFHTDEDVIGAARFLAGLDPTIPFKLLRFRPHGTAGPALGWESPSDETMDRFVSLAKGQGLISVIRSL